MKNKQKAITEMTKCFADAGEIITREEAREILENEIAFGEAE